MSIALLFDVAKWTMQNPELGWIVVLAYLFLELRSRYGRIHDLRFMVLSAITVIRALARVQEDIDTKAVDDYLLENGTEPDDFISDPDEDNIQSDMDIFSKQKDD